MDKTWKRIQKNRCSACKKAIKTEVVQCKSCVKLFFHPGCVNKHKIYDRNKDVVQYHVPFKKFMIDSDNGEGMKKVKVTKLIKVAESLRMKPKLKIVFIDEKEWKLRDEELIETIKKQNKFGI